MKPSSRRIRAISTLMRLGGRETVSWRAPAALRTRVSRSATGSFGMPTDRGRDFFAGSSLRVARSAGLASPACSPVTCSSIKVILSPARLRDPGQLAHERALPEADPAETELPHEATGPAADLAPTVALHLVPGRSAGLQDEALLRHQLPLTTRCGTASRGCAAARGPLRPSSPW